MYHRPRGNSLSDQFIEKLAKHILAQEVEQMMQDLDITLANIKQQLDSAEWVPLEGSGGRQMRSVSLGYVDEGLSDEARHELFWRAQEMGLDLRVEDDGELVAFEMREDPRGYLGWV